MDEFEIGSQVHLEAEAERDMSAKAEYEQAMAEEQEKHLSHEMQSNLINELTDVLAQEKSRGDFWEGECEKLVEAAKTIKRKEKWNAGCMCTESSFCIAMDALRAHSEATEERKCDASM